MRLTLNGHVVSDEHQWLYDWFEIPAFSPGKVRDALRETPEGEELTLEINSGGGSVFAGFEMYTLLRSAARPTVAEVQSLAGSAASILMEGCGRVLLSPVAQVMIHLPATVTDGNQGDHRQSLQLLDSVTESILNAYELRCGSKADRARLRALMEAETWLPAQDAVALGLADGLLFETDPAACTLPTSVVASVGGAVRALSGGGLQDEGALLAEYERRVRAGADPAPGHPVPPPAGREPAEAWDDWRARARLNIENSRYI